MSNGPSNPINLTRISTASLKGGHAPLPGSGESAKKDADKYKPVTEHTQVKRTIPVTDFAPADAADDPEAGANGAAAPEPEVAEKDRHTKWRETQEAKRAAREVARIEAAAKRQGLATVLLQKGDLAGAAKALGIPASEFVTLVNQGAMGMKPEEPAPKQLTPEEQRVADETAFREEMKAFRKEQEEYRRTRDVEMYIDKNIRPILADKDAYEMIHQVGAQDIESYAYRYMDQHYRESGGKEVLNAKDVLDAIEENLVKQQIATLERARGVKKVSKYFAPAGADAAQALAEASEPESEPAGSTTLSSSRRARIAEAMSELEAEATPGETQEPTGTPPGNPAAPKIVRPPAPGANIRAPQLLRGRLTAAEKLAKVRAEEEDAARRSLAARR